MKETDHPWSYLAALCTIQGIQYRIENASTFWMSGTLVLPQPPIIGDSTVFPSRLTPVAAIAKATGE